MVQLESGGILGTKALVNTEGRVLGNVVAEGPLEKASDDGNAGMFVSTFATGTTDIEVISIQNTDAKHMHITRFILGATADGIWSVFEVTSGTPAGTVLTFINPNISSGVVNTVTAFGNASVTGTVVGTNLFQYLTLANNSHQVFLEGAIVLGTNDTLAISFSVSATVFVTVMAFWSGDE